MYAYKFKFKYPGVGIKDGRDHIHTPIKTPLFKINKVYRPKSNDIQTSVKFDCQTMGRNIVAYMTSKTVNHSDIVFSGKSSGAFLRLTFEVTPYSEGHELSVKFTCWNPLMLILVPMFPILVLINGIEDEMFFKADTKIEENVHLKLYRLYIFMKAMEGQYMDF